MHLIKRKDLQQATRNFAKSTAASRAHSTATNKALATYGAQGPQISGVIRDHFPKHVKDKLRILARQVTEFSDAGYEARPKGVRVETMRKLSREVATRYGSGFYGPQGEKKMRKKNPEHEIRELILFSENSPSLHNQYTAIMKNLSRKKKRGVYDPVLAAKLWKYWIDEGVKQYNKEILGGGHSLKQNVFTMADRKQAAIEMEDQEQEDVFSLEYLKNPKRRKTMRKKKRSAKQLANDRRLGRMAKARAAKKRGGRRKKVVRKKTRRKVSRRANPKRKVAKRSALKKSHLWIVFRCKRATYGTGVSIAWLGVTKSGTFKFGGKSSAMLFQVKSVAVSTAKKYSTAGFHVGVANKNKTSAAIMKFCREIAAGK